MFVPYELFRDKKATGICTCLKCSKIQLQRDSLRGGLSSIKNKLPNRCVPHRPMQLK
jgi:hypothetical protein